MNSKLIYVLPFITLMGASEIGFAQSKITDSTGEVVMTRAELDSFLNHIADLKRAKMARVRQENQLKELREISEKKQVSASISSNNNDERVLRELDRINSRIDLLMLGKMNSKPTVQAVPVYSGGSYSGRMVDASATLPTASPIQSVRSYQEPSNPEVIYKDSPTAIKTVVVRDTVYIPAQANKTEVASHTLTTAENAEIKEIRGKISSLDAQLSVLNTLSKGDNAQASKYLSEIDLLTKQIAELKAALAQRDAETNEAERKNTAQDLSLNSFRSAIYFVNNSSEIKQEFSGNLLEVIKMAKEQNGRATVVVRGFSSTKGKPEYNEKLAFRRAEAVKKWLISNGLSARDIITMNHGEDPTADDAQARRVELSFLVR